jgi:esterase/lipase
MFEKLDPEDLKRECINAEEKSMKLYSRNAVLEDENKRLRNKFN